MLFAAADTLVTSRCYHWWKYKNFEYVGGEITVWDEVEINGINIFELDSIVEGVGVFAHKREEDEDSGSDNSHKSDSGGSEFSSKDSDYDIEEDNDEYDKNVDRILEWLGVENQRECQEKRAKNENPKRLNGIGLGDDCDSNFGYFEGDVAPYSAARYKEKMSDNANIDIYSIRNEVMKRGKCYLMKNQSYRGKRHVLKMIQGNEGDQYSKLSKYIKAIERSTPRSTVNMKLVDDECLMKAMNRLNFRDYTCAFSDEGWIFSCFNWSPTGFKGIALRHALYATAKATTLTKFVAKMKELVDIDEDAAKWLDDKPAGEWSRAHFRTFPKCDMLLNNICESFNSKILDVREDHIIGMTEKLRLAPGRSKKKKKKRRKGEDEVQQMKEKRMNIRRTGQVNTCKFCQERDHNIRSYALRKEAQNTENDADEIGQQGPASTQQDDNMAQELSEAAGLGEGTNFNITNIESSLFEIVLEQVMFEEQKHNGESNPKKGKKINEESRTKVSGQKRGKKQKVNDQNEGYGENIIGSSLIPWLEV
ncbi:hypothetical protein ACH5RR_018583 [Cinchona calisaya]|uniref:Transposase n=1 Tax=Cinchona calisaya TaxID=153742 RepID=A0ABD2ZMC9_9GENT